MTENTGFDAYSLYNGLKLHFSGKYDFIKYNGKTNASRTTFSTRKDKYQFYKLSRKYNPQELRDFYIANFLEADIDWVGNLLTPEGEERYKKWQKRIQSLTYKFKEDILHMLNIWEQPEDMLKVTDGQYPPLLRECMMGMISIETVIILNDIMNFFPMWSRKIQDDVVWPAWERKMLKYAPFLNYDKTKFISTLKETMKENAEA